MISFLSKLDDFHGSYLMIARWISFGFLGVAFFYPIPGQHYILLSGTFVLLWSLLFDSLEAVFYCLKKSHSFLIMNRGVQFLKPLQWSEWTPEERLRGSMGWVTTSWGRSLILFKILPWFYIVLTLGMTAFSVVWITLLIELVSPFLSFFTQPLPSETAFSSPSSPSMSMDTLMTTWQALTSCSQFMSLFHQQSSLLIYFILAITLHFHLRAFYTQPSRSLISWYSENDSKPRQRSFFQIFQHVFYFNPLSSLEYRALNHLYQTRVYRFWVHFWIQGLISQEIQQSFQNSTLLNQVKPSESLAPSGLPQLEPSHQEGSWSFPPPYQPHLYNLSQETPWESTYPFLVQQKKRHASYWQSVQEEQLLFQATQPALSFADELKILFTTWVAQSPRFRFMTPYLTSTTGSTSPESVSSIEPPSDSLTQTQRSPSRSGRL